MAIKTHKKKAQTQGPHLMSILEDICLFYKKTAYSVIDKSDDKSSEYVIIKRLYCYVAYKLTNAPLKDIGALWGKDHSFVITHRDIVVSWIKNGQTKWIDEWFDWLEWTTLWGAYEKLR